MTPRYVRILAEATADNSDEVPFYIDAIIDEDGKICGKHALFGVLGRFDRKDEQFEPFVLDSNGQLDWGDGFDETPNERFGELDLRDAPVSENRLLTMRTINYETTYYRITRIDALPHK